jgi:hypothetical protein
MAETVLLVDLRRDSELTRQVVADEQELRDFLETEESFDYLLVERIPNGKLKKDHVMKACEIKTEK